MKKQTIIISLLFIVLALTGSGCASYYANEQLKIYKEKLDKMAGIATREDVAMQFGIPSRKDFVGTTEIWEYYMS